MGILVLIWRAVAWWRSPEQRVKRALERYQWSVAKAHAQTDRCGKAWRNSWR